MRLMSQFPHRRPAARTVHTMALLACLATPCRLAAQQLVAQEVHDTLHGVPVSDPFRSLEDTSITATKSWIRHQDSLTRAELAKVPGRAVTRAALVELFARPMVTAPLRRGPLEFYGRRNSSGPGGTSDVLVRPRGSSEEGRVLLLGTTTRGRGFVPSPDGRFLAYSEGDGGSLWSAVSVMRVSDGRNFDDTPIRIHLTQSGVVWDPDGEGFFYQHTPPSAQGGEVAPSSVRYHRLGAAHDPTVFTPPDDAGSSVVRIARRDGDLLVILLTDNATSHDRVFVADARHPDRLAKEVRAPGGGYTYVGELGSSPYFYTTADAPRGRIVRIDRPLVAPRWQTVVPESDEVINTWPGVGATIAGGHLLVAYGPSVARLRPRLFDAEGRFVRGLALPENQSIWSGFVGEAASDTVFYQVSGLGDPGSVRQVILSTGHSTAVDFGGRLVPPPDFVTEQVDAIAADGSRIPVDLIYRRGTPRDGTAPLVLYGYGFGGWQPAPYFQPGMAQFVREGGIWAITAPRGDGVHGEGWRWAGAKRNKEVGIADYVAVARWLVANRYTSADRLVANGSSAGGPLVGGAVLLAPEAFGAVILDYPLLDMVRYEQFGYAAQWRSDLGTAEDPGDFAVLHRVSPYHRAIAGACHPPMLVAPGERDRTTPAHHAYKFVAALQAHRPERCREQRAMLRVTWGGGHNAGSTVDDQIETFTDQLAFLKLVLPQ
jgi:prolyl oligopeptidase